MIGQTGAAPQYTPSVVQNSPQQAASKQQAQQVIQNQQAQAQNIIKQAASAPVQNVDPTAGRGQVVNLLV